MESLTDLEEWDPLADDNTNQTVLLDEMKKKEIKNILRSYTGHYDLFAELIQNSLDALDMRSLIEGPHYEPQLWIHIDIQQQTVSVSDNGIGLSNDELHLFLKPNLSFKKGNNTRGNKGVGATYLAYGFNYLQIATRVPEFEYAGTMEQGREWIEDTTGYIPRPHIRPTQLDDPAFANVDRGASFTVKLFGNGIRPKDLSWIGATIADKWDAVLRIKTPLGGIYLFDTTRPRTVCHLKVTGSDGQISQKDIVDCQYYYPNTIPGKHVPLSTLIRYAEKTAKAARPIPKWPPNYSQLTSIYDTFTADEILTNTSPLKPTLTEGEIHIMKEHKPDVAVYFVYSTHFWDNFNDNILGLRSGLRVLRGGLQLATQGMIQGELQGYSFNLWNRLSEYDLSYCALSWS
jgi:hypothetical protein